MLDTGRRWVGPTGDIVERQDPRTGERFLVLVLQEHYPRLPAVRSALDVGRGFLEQPLVDGVAPLREAQSDTGVCVYDARDMLVLAAMLDELGPAQAPGPRAAATLGTLATAILVEAAEAGELSGVFCHGDVSPWRILVGVGGEVGLLGYGIPEVEACRMRHTGADRPMVPSMGWAPPERLSGRPEDVRSDLFSLALVCAQVATGVPVLRGSPDEVYGQARAGVARELFGREPFASLPTALRRHLARMLGPSPSERPGPAAWADGWLAVLDATDSGPDLDDTATIVARRWEERGRVGVARALADPTSTRNSLVTLSRLLERRREPLPVLLPTDDDPAPTPTAWTPTEPVVPENDASPRRVEAPARPVRRAPPEPPRVEPTLARPTLSTQPHRLDAASVSPPPIVAADPPAEGGAPKPAAPSPAPADRPARVPAAPQPTAVAPAAPRPPAGPDRPARAEPAPPPTAVAPATPRPPADADRPARAEPTLQPTTVAPASPRPPADADRPARAEPAPQPTAGAPSPPRPAADAERPARVTPAPAPTQPTAAAPAAPTDSDRPARAAPPPAPTQPTAAAPTPQLSAVRVDRPARVTPPPQPTAVAPAAYADRPTRAAPAQQPANAAPTPQPPPADTDRPVRAPPPTQPAAAAPAAPRPAADAERPARVTPPPTPPADATAARVELSAGPPAFTPPASSPGPTPSELPRRAVTRAPANAPATAPRADATPTNRPTPAVATSPPIGAAERGVPTPTEAARPPNPTAPLPTRGPSEVSPEAPKPADTGGPSPRRFGARPPPGRGPGETGS
jgi:hypothetical protein